MQGQEVSGCSNLVAMLGLLQVGLVGAKQGGFLQGREGFRGQARRAAKIGLGLRRGSEATEYKGCSH